MIAQEKGQDVCMVIGLKAEIRKIVSGDFVEGGRVTVNVDGRIVSRKVRWDAEAKDLSVVVDNKRYFLYEFTD